jgi:hypothetical protein
LEGSSQKKGCAGTRASGTPLSGAPTDPGTYKVVASFPGSTDYSAALATITFTIFDGGKGAG